jgi:Ca2+-transporting ATPase
MLSLLQGAVSSIVVAFLYAWTLHIGIETGEARAMAFVALITANTALIYSSRSVQPFSHRSFRSLSRVGWRVVAGTVAALAFITLIPPAAVLFGFSPLSPFQWIGSFGAGIAALAGFEIVKKLFSRSFPPALRH